MEDSPQMAPADMPEQVEYSITTEPPPVRINSFMRFNSAQTQWRRRNNTNGVQRRQISQRCQCLRCSSYPSSIAPSFTVCLALSHLYDTRSLFIPLAIHYPCHFILPFLCPKVWASLACHRWYHLSGLLGISWGIYGHISPHKGYNILIILLFCFMQHCLVTPPKSIHTYIHQDTLAAQICPYWCDKKKIKCSNGITTIIIFTDTILWVALISKYLMFSWCLSFQPLKS